MESNQDLTHKSLKTWQGVVSAIFLILLSCLFSFFLQQLKLPSQKCVFSVGMSRKAQLINQLHHPLGGGESCIRKAINTIHEFHPNGSLEKWLCNYLPTNSQQYLSALLSNMTAFKFQGRGKEMDAPYSFQIF
jgi:hypothetical protein